MRELSTNELELTVGGNLATGWMPANYYGVAINEEALRSFGWGSIRIPGLIPGPVFTPGPVAFGSDTGFIPHSTSDC
jgi:hypothetical protein